MWRGSHAGFAGGANTPSVGDYPSFLYTESAPAVGFAVETTGLSWIHSRVSYRRVYDTGTALTTQFPQEGGGGLGGFHDVTGTRISQDRVGWAADMEKRDLGALKGGLVYDLYNQIFSRYFAGAEAYLGKRVTLGADADYFVPTFDGDSIWNWFAHGPITTVSGRASFRFTKRFDMTASGGARLWQVQGDPTPGTGMLSTYGAGECAAVKAATIVPIACALGKVNYDASAPIPYAYATDPANRPTITTVDGMGNLNARARWGFGDVSLRSMIEAGSRGSREGGDLAGEARWDGGRFTTGARASVYGWHDPTRPDRDAVSFGYVLAGGFRPAKIAKFRIEFEHDTNRLVGQRYRAVGLIDVLVLK